MKLITEMANEQDVEFLVENTKAGKKYYVEGRWMTANETNRNGRMYPSAVMEAALSKYNTEYITQRRAMGELNHPAGPGLNLDRVSHVIENLRMEGNHVTGRAKVMDTPMGIIAQKLIDEGIKLGVSSRGLGSLKSTDGVNVVQNDFFISAIDIVNDPSGPGCWISGIMEGVDYRMLEDGRIIEMATELVVAQKKKKLDEAKAIRLFENFIKGLG
jgi:hypothetical protein